MLQLPSWTSVAQEVVPFGIGGFAVFAAGSLCSSSRDEGLMVFDDVAVVDSNVALSGVYRQVSECGISERVGVDGSGCSSRVVQPRTS